MSSPSQRDLYLAQFWPRYPVIPAVHAGMQVSWGRLSSAGALERMGGEVTSFSLADVQWYPESHEIPPRDVLRAGDWVTLVEQDGLCRVQLLAPQLAEPLTLEYSLATSRAFHIFVRGMRDFFHDQGFIETPTPTLVGSPGTEPHLQPFATQFQLGSKEVSLFLPFSPEFHLKKLLSLGWERIFELRPCFRNNELSPTHQPEFWMLEWYRAGCDLEALLSDVDHLVKTTAQVLERPLPPTLQRVSIAELFAQNFAFTLTPHTSCEELRGLAVREQIATSADDTWDDLFFRLFIDRIERSLGFNGPIAVYDYPPSQAALARINARGWADRFEVYWKGLELANAFHELNDPVEQRRRLKEDLSRRKQLGATPVSPDADFLRALDAGLPPSAGIALGVERLFMALMDLSRLEQVRAFPISMSEPHP